MPRPKNAVLESAYDGSDVLSRHHQRTDKRCSLKEFTKKRREMLMLNLSIATQQEEIDKLHADLERRERNLREKEAGLDENLKRFDNFLKEEYQRKVTAAKLLDETLSQRAAKEERAKSTSQRLSILEAGIRKHKDTIEQGEKCRRLCASLREEMERQARSEGEGGEPTDSDASTHPRAGASGESSEEEQGTGGEEEDPPYFGDAAQLMKAMKAVEEGNRSLAKKIQEGEARLRSQADSG